MSKKILIVVVTVLLAAVFWLSATRWLASPEAFHDYVSWVLPLVFLTVLIAVQCLAYILLPERKMKFLITAGISLLFLVVFGVTRLLLLGVVLLFVCDYFAMKNIEHEAEGRIELHPGLMARRGVNELLIPILLCISFVFFQGPIVADRASSRELPQTFKTVIARALDTFFDQSGDKDTTPAIRYAALNRVFELFVTFSAPYQKYFPPFLAFGLFMILWGLSFIFRYVSVLLTMGLFALLKRWKFFEVQEKDVKSEFVVL